MIKRQGMAIPLVLIFATIMGVVSAYLYKIAKQSNQQNLTNVEQLQSYFIARAGAEHVMLKIKYLHRELYDAICLYQGRNPLFDFSQITNLSAPYNAIKSFNPGPIYLYDTKSGLSPITGTVYTEMNKKTSYSNNNYKNWLETFKSDLLSKGNPNGFNKFLDLDNIPTITNNMYMPYRNAEYKLEDISLPALQVEEKTKNLIQNYIIIQFKVKSVFISNRGNAFDYEITRSIKISREDDLRWKEKLLL